TGSRRRVLVRRARATPASGQRRRGVQERTTDLVLRVGLLRQQGGQQGTALTSGRRAGGRTRAVVRQAAAMRRVDGDGRRDGARVSLSLGDTSPRLHVGIERDGDGG